MAKKYFYAAINDNEARIVTTWDECAKITQNKRGGHSRKFLNRADAETYLFDKIDERDKRKQRAKPKRNRIYGSSSTQCKPTLDHLAIFLEPKTAVMPKKKIVTLSCSLGTDGKASKIKLSNGALLVVQTSVGAKAPLKRLELGYEALKVAEDTINGGADFVEIIGLDDSVGRTLCKLTPDWKGRGWLNSTGKQPANLELIKRMFDLYERFKGKVKLGQKPTENSDIDDLPF
ncbi:viroplasmin family protein [Photobacterium rosenbergii]|uniref:Viroplasmin family protein n=1 Tax=Photobacterium rosenbergii TaxID=294936 RepID=A0ABU3ZLM4_9GAMM|nr:viroplasmin family protein [Photobacterium rosenbergii]MDV5170980.1 viroplasmin family protein [Photobacterium rosenbergii]